MCKIYYKTCHVPFECKRVLDTSIVARDQHYKFSNNGFVLDLKEQGLVSLFRGLSFINIKLQFRAMEACSPVQVGNNAIEVKYVLKDSITILPLDELF